MSRIFLAHNTQIAAYILQIFCEPHSILTVTTSFTQKNNTMEVELKAPLTITINTKMTINPMS